MTDETRKGLSCPRCKGLLDKQSFKKSRRFSNSWYVCYTCRKEWLIYASIRRMTEMEEMTDEIQVKLE